MDENPNTQELQNGRGWYRKILLLERSGGGCEKCGYNENLSALSFHHIEPDKKSFTLDSRHLSNMSWSKILDEFEKCKLLCANCHREVHHPDRNVERVKGKLSEKYDPRLKQKDRCCECGELNKSFKFLRCVDCRNKCEDCGKDIYPRSSRCNSCYRKSREKIDWPKVEWLKRMTEKYSFKALERRLGVSDNAIRKRIENHSD